MPHNPSETHCPKCDVQLTHTSAMGESWSYCPNCDYDDSPPEDEVNKDQEDSRYWEDIQGGQ